MRYGKAQLLLKKKKKKHFIPFLARARIVFLVRQREFSRPSVVLVQFLEVAPVFDSSAIFCRRRRAADVVVTARLLFTLQMKLALRALQKDGANRVQIVIAAASQRPRPCLCHLQEN